MANYWNQDSFDIQPPNNSSNNQQNYGRNGPYHSPHLYGGYRTYDRYINYRYNRHNQQIQYGVFYEESYPAFRPSSPPRIQGHTNYATYPPTPKQTAPRGTINRRGHQSTVTTHAVQNANLSRSRYPSYHHHSSRHSPKYAANSYRWHPLTTNEPSLSIASDTSMMMRNGSRFTPNNDNINNENIINQRHDKQIQTGSVYKPTYLDSTETQHTLLGAGFIREISMLLPENTIIPIEIYPVPDLIISGGITKVLRSDVLHEYDRVIINGALTTTNWNGKNGGKLFIKCNYMEIQHGGRVHVNGKGYRGGKGGGYQGESYNGKGQMSYLPNHGGGGGGGREGAAGGGGYGTKGGDVKDGGFGGSVYGDAELSTLYLGSGGGGYFNQTSGNGGGIIDILAERLVIGRGASIASNGTILTCGGGGGSGGSIYIKSREIMNNGSIEVKGGEGSKYSGDGGFGRIRIDSSNFESRGSIIPKVGYSAPY